MTIERKEVRPLRGVRAVQFLSSAIEASDDTMLLDADLLARVADWLTEHPDVALLRIEFDQWGTNPTGATYAERLLNAVGLGPHPTISKHTATVYYETEPDSEGVTT